MMCDCDRGEGGVGVGVGVGVGSCVERVDECGRTGMRRR